ncbi:MAG: alanine racemase [Tissierellia bacterium]|nr:alanine racemase [Tissierellia bacterium]
MEKIHRPLWMEIRRRDFEENLATIKGGLSEGTQLLAVLKDNAYGLGSETLGRWAHEWGIRHFAVANIYEGLQLRSQVGKSEILILGYNEPAMVPEAIEAELSLLVWNLPMAEQFSRVATELGREAKIHLAVDTGLSRLGFFPTEESLGEMEAIAKLPGIKIMGTMSHLARTETDDHAFTQRQLETFLDFVDEMRARGLAPGTIHMADSAGLVKFPEAHLEMVRCGALLSGSLQGRHFVPGDEIFALNYVMSLKAKIARVAHYPNGASVSYDATFETDEAITVATLPVGYGDGLGQEFEEERGLWVLISGVRCPMLGSINMDMMMVDVTGVDCKEGDEVVLLGKQGDDEITLDDWSDWGGKSPTAYQSLLQSKIPKLYIEQ